MKYELIYNDDQLEGWCRQLEHSPRLAIDTEFVSEDTYRPQLCLLQVATDDQLAIVDPLGVARLDPFWQLLVSGGREVVVHAGREEFRFCWQATGVRPAGWFDVQVAAGIVGLDYPASYGNLISKLLGVTLEKSETRTDWRRRPLTRHQLDYAVADVSHLLALRDELDRRLAELGRQHWLEGETEHWQARLVAEDSAERWWRLGGLSGLSPRGLAIARELWHWRETEAQRRDRPPRRVLRDDLVVELARRARADLRHIRSLRGMERRNLERDLPHIAACVRRALELPEDERPRRSRGSAQPQFHLVVQFLTTGLAALCREAHIAPGLVGTAQDVREFVLDRLGCGDGPQAPRPALSDGWRAQLVGDTLGKILEGRLALRVGRPRDDQPLVCEPVRRDPP